jgi:hypothetical protein
MTALAFILGVVPLVVVAGAGARRAPVDGARSDAIERRWAGLLILRCGRLRKGAEEQMFTIARSDRAMPKSMFEDLSHARRFGRQGGTDSKSAGESDVGRNARPVTALPFVEVHDA